MTTSTETVAEQPGTGDPAATRMTGLSAQVHRLRTNASAGGFDRWLLFAGALLMPVGVVLILLGWSDASRTPLVYEQIPYLISGGILGLALAVIGGFTYFAYWQTVRIRESRNQTVALTRAIGRLETLLAGGAASELTGIEPTEPTYLATANGSIFHRPDCTAVAGRDDASEVDITTTTLTPCRICTPLDPA
jgi:hypothetical protein